MGDEDLTGDAIIGAPYDAAVPAAEPSVDGSADGSGDGSTDAPTGEPTATASGEAAGDAKSRKLSREEAREAAEAEKAAREAQAYEEALELARADAERMLAGPGLVSPEPPISPTELEEGWSDATRNALNQVTQDLEGHRLGLAISGGGALGSFEAGALRFLYDHLHVEPVAICGNSAGALNAAKLAEGDHADRRPIDEVERLWRSLRINSDMWEPEPWLVRLQASATWASELREQVTDADGTTSTVRVAVRVVGSLVRRPPETDGTIDAVKDAIRAKSLLSLSPIAELVERELDPARVRASGIALRMGTVSLEAGELRYVTEHGALHDRYDRPIDQPPVPLTSGVLASASIPMAFPPVEMNDEHYVDGGAREILPLELLANRIGADRVIAISAGSAAIHRAPSFADRNLIDILRRVSAEIGPNETLRKELNPPGGWDPHIRLVVPEFDVHDSMTIDPALIAISLDHGYMRAADVIGSLGSDADLLTEQITRLRIALRELAGPVPTFLDTALGRDRRERIEGRPTRSGPDKVGEPVIDTGATPVEDGNRDGLAKPDEARGREDRDAEPRDGEVRSAEGVVRSARARTATTVAKLVKVMGRDSGERDERGRPGHDDAEAGRIEVAGDGVGAEGPAGSGDQPTVQVDVEVANLIGASGGTDGPPADVAVSEVDGSVEVVVAPRSTSADGGNDGDEDTAVGDDEVRDEKAKRPGVPDLDDDQGLDREADEARRTEVQRISAELRSLVQQRLDLGYPLPQTLVAWLRDPGPGDSASADEEHPDELHPVGGSALGGA